MEQTSVSSIISKMQLLKDSMTKSEQNVIQYIIERPHDVIYASVAELASNCKVSEATITRACKRLGLSGYQELKITLAKEIVNPLQTISEDVEVGDDTSVIAAKIFKSIINTLNFTYDTLNFPDLDAAAEKIISAKNIVIFGVGNSSAIALDLQHKLMRLGFNASAYSDPHMASIAISYFNSQDVLICISHSGSSKEVVDIAVNARTTDATIISITNIGTSPLSKVSDINLHTASNETRYRIVALDSRIAQLSIINTLFAMITLRSEQDKIFHVDDMLKSRKY